MSADKNVTEVKKETFSNFAMPAANNDTSHCVSQTILNPQELQNILVPAKELPKPKLVKIEKDVVPAKKPADSAESTLPSNGLNAIKYERLEPILVPAKTLPLPKIIKMEYNDNAENKNPEKSNASQDETGIAKSKNQSNNTPQSTQRPTISVKSVADVNKSLNGMNVNVQKIPDNTKQICSAHTKVKIEIKEEFGDNDATPEYGTNLDRIPKINQDFPSPERESFAHNGNDVPSPSRISANHCATSVLDPSTPLQDENQGAALTPITTQIFGTVLSHDDSTQVSASLLPPQIRVEGVQQQIMTPHVRNIGTDSSAKEASVEDCIDLEKAYADRLKIVQSLNALTDSEATSSSRAISEYSRKKRKKNRKHKSERRKRSNNDQTDESSSSKKKKHARTRSDSEDLSLPVTSHKQSSDKHQKNSSPRNNFDIVEPPIASTSAAAAAARLERNRIAEDEVTPVLAIAQIKENSMKCADNVLALLENERAEHLLSHEGFLFTQTMRILSRDPSAKKAQYFEYRSPLHNEHNTRLQVTTFEEVIDLKSHGLEEQLPAICQIMQKINLSGETLHEKSTAIKMPPDLLKARKDAQTNGIATKEVVLSNLLNVHVSTQTVNHTASVGTQFNNPNIIDMSNMTEEKKFAMYLVHEIMLKGVMTDEARVMQAIRAACRAPICIADRYTHNYS